MISTGQVYKGDKGRLLIFYLHVYLRKIENVIDHISRAINFNTEVSKGK